MTLAVNTIDGKNPMAKNLVNFGQGIGMYYCCYYDYYVASHAHIA